jgi:hypothetical protein
MSEWSNQLNQMLMLISIRLKTTGQDDEMKIAMETIQDQQFLILFTSQP